MSYQYVTDLVRDIAQQLETEYQSPRTANSNAWALLEKLTGKKQARLLAEQTIELSMQDLQILQGWIDAITQEHKPIQYIIGSVPFIDTEILVEPPVVIPRPETEYWCHTLITQLREHGIEEFRLLDMCTGSGCVAVAIAHAFPRAQVYAADISEQALELATKNAHHNNVSITCIQSNVFEQISLDIMCDIIVANPPYITRDEWNDVRKRITGWENPQALVAANNGLRIIQDIITSAPQHLKPWSHAIPQLWIEIGYLQGAKTSELFEKSGFSNIQIYKDLSGHDRVVTGCLT